MSNLLFVTGDTHSSWLYENNPKDASDNGWRIIEMGTTSVSSPNADERHPMDTIRQAEQSLLRDNPHLNYVDLSKHGYLLVEVTPDSLHGQWKYVDNLRSPDYELNTGYSVSFPRK